MREKNGGFWLLVLSMLFLLLSPHQALPQAQLFSRQNHHAHPRQHARRRGRTARSLGHSILDQAYPRQSNSGDGVHAGRRRSQGGELHVSPGSS